MHHPDVSVSGLGNVLLIGDGDEDGAVVSVEAAETPREPGSLVFSVIMFNPDLWPIDWTICIIDSGKKIVVRKGDLKKEPLREWSHANFGVELFKPF